MRCGKYIKSQATRCKAEGPVMAALSGSQTKAPCESQGVITKSGV